MKRLAFTVLALLMAISACCPASGKAGLGLSHYGPVAVIYVNRTSQPIPVGRVYNTGTEDLAITCTWTQKDGVKVLPMMVSPLHTSFVLQPDASQEVALIMNVVDAGYVGEYYGEVDVAAAIRNVPQGSGSSVVPGGTLTANISIIKSLNPASLQLSNLTLTAKTVNVGDTLGASVWAANTGDLAENFSFTLKMDDAFMRDKTVTFEGGESKQVTFSFVVSNAGEHTVHILGSWANGNLTLSETVAVLGGGLPLEWFGVALVILVFAVIVVAKLSSKRNEPQRHDRPK
jgi:hypothetical protein